MKKPATIVASQKSMEKRSKYWHTLCDILDSLYPKGKSKERGKALVMLAFIEMVLRGKNIKFCESGHIMVGTGFDECPECEEAWKK